MNASPIHLLLALALVWGLVPSIAEKPPEPPPQSTSEISEVAVYLLAGQSNMQGFAPLAQLPADWLKPLPGVHFWVKDRYQTLNPQETPLAKPGHFGPELGFARASRQSGNLQDIYLIKFYRSGQPLHPGWDGNQWLGSPYTPHRKNFYPGRDDQDPAQGAHYQAMVTQFKAALKAILADGKIPLIKGILWMQGEQDAKNSQSAQEYAHQLMLLQGRLKREFKLERLPFIYGQILPENSPAIQEKFPYREIIRERMASLDQDTGNPGESFPDFGMVSTKNFPMLPDQVHFNTQGHQQLGQAFATRLNQIISNPQPYRGD